MPDQRKIQGYGWKPSLPSIKDVKLTLGKPKVLPLEIDLRKDMPEVYDQSELGSCTSQMAAGAYQYALKQAKLPDFMPSRLFIYYNERIIEGTTDYDSGAEIKDALKCMNEYGVCNENSFPYDIRRFREKPPLSAYAEAKNNVIHNYAKLDNTNLQALKQCLSHKFPIGFGFTVYSAFEGEEVGRTGELKMPQPNENVMGGHAVLAVGYNDKRKVFYVRNSWGSNWGDSGYFTMPYEYITNPNLAADFWMLRLTKNK